MMIVEELFPVRRPTCDSLSETDLRGLVQRRDQDLPAGHHPPPPELLSRPHQAHLLPPPLGGGEARPPTVPGGGRSLGGQ